MLQSDLLGKYSLASVRYAWAGSAPLSPLLQRKFLSYLSKGAVFNQAWGMSEVCGTGMHLPPPEQDLTGAAGRPLPNCDVKLVNDDGHDITAFDMRGELCIRGPIVFRGYYKNEAANDKNFDADGFFHTGDIAYCDASSKLWYIVDRKKVSLYRKP